MLNFHFSINGHQTNNNNIFNSCFQSIQSRKQTINSNAMDTSKETETVNKETGVTEIKVDTVDYRTPPGDNKLPEKKDIEVVHQIVDEESNPGVIQKGIAAVGRAAESAKEAITGTKTDKA